MAKAMSINVDVDECPDITQTNERWNNCIYCARQAELDKLRAERRRAQRAEKSGGFWGFFK
jgi:hypothetical protein